MRMLKPEGGKVSDDYILPPQQEAKRRTPEVVLREIRKFSLEQAVKALPEINPSSAPGGVIGVAAEFEDYIRNGLEDGDD